MYVHLGGDIVIRVTDVVAVLDARLLASSEINREFVDKSRHSRRLRGGGPGEDRKALVVTAIAVIASGISPATLARRMAGVGAPAMAWERETPR